ncbi:hypothetical protein PIB30_016228 [Stylosanthes scabra]|uniref:Uncharacterized protein n=1 Tax=Stylosanthes scabra TaxID=79078 RepID=A0ABU6X776_9FABA|nr:hypothetical protein [Stylosanthes scabra]
MSPVRVTVLSSAVDANRRSFTLNLPRMRMLLFRTLSTVVPSVVFNSFSRGLVKEFATLNLDNQDYMKNKHLESGEFRKQED